MKCVFEQCHAACGMWKSVLIVTLALLAGSFCHEARASDVVAWGDATKGWRVFVDREIGNACFIEKDFSDGLRVQFGLRPLKEGAFFAVYRSDWHQLVAGDEGELFLDVGSDTFGGTALVKSGDGFKGIYAFFDNPELAQAMARKHKLTLRGMGIEETIVDLAGTAVSFQSIRTCQDEQVE